MEVIVTLVWLIYHVAASIGPKLEVTDAVLLNISHYIGGHTIDEVGTDTCRIQPSVNSVYAGKSHFLS